MVASTKHNKVVVSLTTIPPRAHFLNKTIDSLLNQTHKPDSIELNIPETYKKRNFGSMDISLLPKAASVFRCQDFGPATKLLPTIARYSGQNVCIIYCDDDRLYDRNLIKRLLECHESSPNSAIADEVLEIKSRYYSRKHKKNFTYRIRRFLSGGMWKPNKNNPHKGQIAEGFGGVLVKPEFFTSRAFDIDQEFVMVDDIWFSAMLAYNDVKVRFSNRKAVEKSKPVIANGIDLGRSLDSLVESVHNDMNRNDLDWRAIQLARKRFSVWEDPLSELGLY
jgi:hypothetical protein